MSRLRLLPLLGRGQVIAEIGTARGGFAKRIALQCRPKQLHLIDPWGGPTDQYATTYGLRFDLQKWYDEVCAMFRGDPSITIHRDYSNNAVPKFADNFFDWVFIDGMHDYDSVSADLKLVDAKVKEDGLILGHDFSNAGRKGFGVIAAVLDFLETKPAYKLVAVTRENAPSYVIAKTDAAATRITEKILLADPLAISVPHSAFREVKQQRHMFAGKPALPFVFERFA